jgi:hypothetical protein
MTNEPTPYYPRFSQAEDHDKILDFYNDNAHKNVLNRDPEVLKKMIGNGDVVLIEDAAGKIVASSIMYPFATTDAQGEENVKWQEIGTLRCTLNGYGLMDALVTLQTLRTFLVEPPSDRFIAHMETTPVQNMAKNLGFREFSPLKEVFNLKAAMVPNYGSPPGLYVNWYQGGIETMPVMARALVKLFDKPVIENKKTQEKIVLDFSRSNFCQTLQPAIRSLAVADLGDVDKPDFSKSVKKQQKELVRNFFH